MLRLGPLALGSLAAFSAAMAVSDNASACGGCFHEEEVAVSSETSVVASHRMAFSISTDQTVLWDQVAFSGNPADFAWVLPVKPGAQLDLASDAFFEALEAATAVNVTSPMLQCPNDGSFLGDGGDYGSSTGCCGSTSDLAAGDGASFEGGSGGSGGSGNAGNPPDVEVVHHETVGPYETVTLSANVEGALTGWLADNGYAIDEEIEPIIDAYVAEGFDFIALRLAPGAGVNQMRPVRVTSPGATPTMPLRMVAAGTGAQVGLTLFVISEARYEAGNFPNATPPYSDVVWDFASQSSNYAELREETLSKAGGTWLTSYSKLGSLLSPTIDPITNAEISYTVGSDNTGTDNANTIAEAYIKQGYENGSADYSISADDCIARIENWGQSTSRVVGCGDEGGAGGGGEGTGGIGGIGGDPGTGGVGGIGGSPGGMGGEPGTGGGEANPCDDLGQAAFSADELACGPLDDLAVAFTGLHPADVWLTKLESDLPRAALATDLEIAPSQNQNEVHNRMRAPSFENPPCADAVMVAASFVPVSGKKGPAIPRDVTATVALAGLAMLVLHRRRQRAAAAKQKPAAKQ